MMNFWPATKSLILVYVYPVERFTSRCIIVPGCGAHNHKTTGTVSENCEKQRVISAFFTGTISSLSWSCFIEWVAPTCLTHHFPPHCECGGKGDVWVVVGREPDVLAFYCPVLVLPAWLVRVLPWVLQISKCPIRANAQLSFPVWPEDRRGSTLFTAGLIFHLEDMALRDSSQWFMRNKNLWN